MNRRSILRLGQLVQSRRKSGVEIYLFFKSVGVLKVRFHVGRVKDLEHAVGSGGGGKPGEGEEGGGELHCTLRGEV